MEPLLLQISQEMIAVVQRFFYEAEKDHAGVRDVEFIHIISAAIPPYLCMTP